MGPVVAALRDLYFDVVRGKKPEYRNWCHPVYAGAPVAANPGPTAPARAGEPKK
jgi:branched-chain amino acid aminotransferase